MRLDNFIVMRKRICILFIGLCLGTVVLMAQDVLSGVATAFRNGNSEALDKYMSNGVSLVLADEKAEITSRSNVEAAICRFFSTHQVKSFDINHKGKREESGFIVGTLQTSNGIYRVNCYLKKIENNYLIYQIRIDKTNE